MGKSSHEEQWQEDEKLLDQDQKMMEEIKEYLLSKKLSKMISHKLMAGTKHQMLKARRENEDFKELIGDVNLYCDKEIQYLEGTIWRASLLSMVRTGLIIISLFFTLQALVYLISLAVYGHSGATLKHVSILPLLIFAILGYGGLALLFYVYTNTHRIRRPWLWKVSGWVSLTLGTGLFFASMSLWDEVLIIPLNAMTSLVIALISFSVSKWMTVPLKKFQRHRTVYDDQSN